MRIKVIILSLLCTLAASAQTSEEWRDSLSVLSAMIEQRPNDLEFRMRKAECNIMLEQWDYALEEYSKILELHPKHIGALYFRAYVNGKLHRYAFARQDYEEVLLLEPNHKNALTGLVLTLMSDGNVQKAYDECNRLVELYPEDAIVYSTRAGVEMAKGLTDFAIDDAAKAVELESKTITNAKRILTIEDDLTYYVVQLYELQKSQPKSDAKRNRKSAIAILTTHGLSRSAAESILK